MRYGLRMPKPQVGRKKPRRTPIKPALDADLRILAEVLDEARRESNAAGWFTPPWNNGWNAAMLAHATWRRMAANPLRLDGMASYIALWHECRGTTGLWRSDVYDKCNELLPVLAWESKQRDGEDHKLLHAAFRCVQIEIADSSGGGHVFNELLRPLFSGDISSHHEQTVMHWRMLDALPDPTPRLSEAFKIAWRRGLYTTAYALAPAVSRVR